MFFKRNNIKRLCAYCLLFFLVVLQHAWTVEAFDAALFTPRDDAFWTTFASYTKAAADDIGLNLEVYNANENQQTMLKQVEAVCKKTTDAIIFMNYQGIGETILQIAEKYKTPAFLVNSTFKTRIFSPRDKYRYWIGELTVDDRHAGTLLVRRLAEIANRKGIEALNIFAFQGVAKDVASILRMDGLRTVVDARKGMRIIDTAAANWDREQAKTIFRKALAEHPEINVVWGANDRMAQGASEVVRELGIDRPMVFGGINWGVNALKALEQGLIDIDIGGHIFDGALAAIMVFDYLNGHDFADERLRFTSNMVAITRQNIEKFNTILVRPELIDFRPLSKTHNPKLLQYNFDLNTIAEKAKPAVLTNEERAWIRQHPVIRVSNELGWPPVNFVENGRPTGFSVEYIKLVAGKVGIRLEFVPGNWSELLQKSYDKELDVMLNIVRNKQRAQHLLFTKPYAGTPTAIFSRIEDRHLRSIEDLVGKKVAVVKEFYTHRYLKEHYPNIELLPTLSTLEGITAVSTGRADAMLDRLAVGNYVIAANFITNVSASGATGIAVLDKAEWCLGVRNDWPELISILWKGIDMVSKDEYATLLNRWYLHGAPITQPRVELTEDEWAWLNRHAPFRVGVDPDFAPYEYVDEYGQHQGIAADYMQLLSERLGVDLNVVPGLSWEQVMDQAREKKLDVVAAVTKTPERSRFLLFSRPYIQYQTAIITRRGYPPVTGLADLAGKKVAMIKDYAYTELALKRQPDIKPVYVDTVLDGLNAVAAGEAEAMVSDLGSAVHKIRQFNLANIQVASLPRFQTKGLTVGVRDDYTPLVSIMNKALRTVAEEERLLIHRRWVDIQAARKRVVLSDEERAFLDAHPVIRVVSEPDYVPFDFRIDGKPAGYSIDYVKLLAERLGIRLEYIKDTWGNLLKKAEKREVDLLHSIFKAPKDRERYLNFTQPYKEVLTAIVVRRDTEDIIDLQDLAKRKVALAKEDSLVAILKKAVPDAHQILFDDYRKVMKAVAFGQVDVAVTELPVAAYQIRSLSLTNLKITAGLSNVGGRDQRYRLAVRKDWPQLIPILEKAMATLTPEELKQLDDKWMALPAGVEAPVQLQLTEEERQWLGDNPVIRTAIDRSWAPVEFLDEEGNFQGISADYINRLEEMLGVKFEIAKGLSWQESMAAFKRGELDLFTSLRRTPEREELFDFTDTYTSFPIAIFTGPEVPYIGSMKELNGRKVGVVKGYAIQELLTNHPAIELVTTGDAVEALEKLSRGEIDAYVGNILVTGYYIGQLGYTHIKVVGETPYRNEQSMGVRKDWPIFASILNKALAAIPAVERTKIYKQWIGVRYEHGFDYSLLWKVIAGALAVLFIFLFWNRKLAGLNRQLLASRSEEESARDEAETARREAEAANQAKSAFLANMSHELRTPLNAILGFSQIMGRDPSVSESHLEDLRIINRSGEHLLALINDVLDMSKIEAGLTTIDKQSFDLNRTLTVIEEMIRSRAGAKGLQFIVNRAADVSRFVRADEQKLRQVLLNLLGNAVKFTDEGQIVLRVQSSKLKAESKIESFQYPPSSKASWSTAEIPLKAGQPVTRIHFEIEDSGVGIAPDEIETIFDAFVQKRSDKTPSEGTGLGLAISRKLVQMMGGDITVTSEVGKGSVFSFDILVDVADRAEIETEKPDRRVIGLEPEQPAYCILVVEDNLANRALLCKLLRAVGLDVYEAVNGQEAIEQYEKRQPHLIWMDIRMPVMDGLEATRRIREIETRNLKLVGAERKSRPCGETRNAEDRTPSFPDETGSPLRSDQHPVFKHVPIVALTAHAFEEEKEVILAAGCDDFVRKPFREVEIFDAMARHLDVRYVYEEGKERKAKGEGEPPRDALTHEALAQLPDDLLAELKQATIDLDVDRIGAIIDQIHELNAAVADGLADLARDFQYDKLLALI